MESKSFSERLTPKEVQLVLDELGVPWRDKKVKKGGWVKVLYQDVINHLSDKHDLSPENPDDWTKFNELNYGFYFEGCEININTGSWASFEEQYSLERRDKDFKEINRQAAKQSLSIDPETDKRWKGDLVRLVSLFRGHGTLFNDNDGSLNWMECDRKSIQWIQSILPKKREPKDLKKFAETIPAKNYVNNRRGNFVSKIPKVFMAMEDITPAAKWVWVEILDQCRGDKDCSWPSVSTIAKATGINRRTVMRSIKQLEEKKLLVTRKKSGSNTLYYPRIPVTLCHGLNKEHQKDTPEHQ